MNCEEKKSELHHSYSHSHCFILFLYIYTASSTIGSCITQAKRCSRTKQSLGKQEALTTVIILCVKPNARHV